VPAYIQNPLSIQDFEAVWATVVDPGYAQGFVNAGEGAGYEAYTQGMAQLARVSAAINTTMEAMYILPWSGQTAEPASGPNAATVMLTISRTGRLQEPLRLGAGLVFFDEVEPEWAVGQGTTIDTGRSYTLVSDLIFLPGQAGPFTVEAVASQPGYGYNNPQPGSISAIEQPGAGYSNAGATVASSSPPFVPSSVQVVQLVVANIAEVVLPQHVGQYVTIADEEYANAFRAVSYSPPSASGANGGALSLEVAFSFRGATYSGAFAPGEILTVKSGATPETYLTFVYGAVVGAEYVVYATLRSSALSSGQVQPGFTVSGQSSGATMTVDLVLGDPPSAAPAPGTASWRILSWTQDWGLSVSNPEQPSGGTSAMLDELGYERQIPRASQEPDASYRQRIAVPADTVSPNAVKRMLNRTLTKGEGLTWCFREVGTSLLPGLFYGPTEADGASPTDDAWDYDCVIVTGSVSGQFVDGEQVYQLLAGGQVAQGHALVQLALPATPFVPGQAATTGTTSPPALVGVGNINAQQGGAFVTGLPIVGKTSGATVVPTRLTGGLQVIDRYKLWLDYLRFRGYFLVDVQPSAAGDFGFFWGGAASGVGSPFDFWDDAPFLCFYDGYAASAAAAYLAAYAGVDSVRAAGVYFEFDLMTGPCV
jgi:hypothetical protein